MTNQLQLINIIIIIISQSYNMTRSHYFSNFNIVQDI